MSNRKKSGMQPEQLARYAANGFPMIPLHKADDVITMPNGVKREVGKAPLDSQWTTRAYPAADKVIARCLAEGRNVGFRLTPDVLIIDVDPKNGGLEGYEKLCFAIGLDPDEAPRVVTGSGGFHCYYSKPADVSVRDTLESDDYNGVEFKSAGRQVVAAGSQHPNGNPYYWSPNHPKIEDGLPAVPTNLLNVIKRPPRSAISGGGQYTPAQLATALARLPIGEFNTNEKWLPAMQASHHATAGEGRAEFIEWSIGDPAFAKDAYAIGKRWDSLHADKNDGVTYRTLNKLLRDYGAADAQAAPPVDVDEFPDIPDEADDDDEEPNALTFDLVAYEPKDPTQIPKREWLYKPSYIRKFMGLTAATGGAGKSSLILVEAVAMACGKDLLGIEPAETLRVLYWNGEDPQQELERRVEAILKQYTLTKADLGDRLFIKSGRDMPIRIAETDNGKTKVAQPMTRAMVRAIRKHRLDVVIIDPFVSSHGVPENDNSGIEVVAKKWADIADKTDCAVHLSHHTRKTGGGPATIEDSRGASALNYAARTRRAINTMSAAEAKAAGMTDDRARLSYFKSDLANSSMTKPTEANDWYRFVSVNLMNGGADPDTGAPTEGDSVGVVVKWQYKKLALDLDANTAREAVAALEEGGPWRADRRADKWAGHAIAKAAGVDIAADGVGVQIAGLIAEWVKDGTLEEYTAEDEHRKPKKYLRPELDFG